MKDARKNQSWLWILPVAALTLPVYLFFLLAALIATLITRDFSGE